jgi:hypothetical protein
MIETAIVSKVQFVLKKNDIYLMEKWQVIGAYVN